MSKPLPSIESPAGEHKRGTMPESAACPQCKQRLYSFTGISPGAVPKPGDMTVCDGCGEILQFRLVLGVLGVTWVSEDTIAGVDLLELQKAQRVVRGLQEHFAENDE